MSTAVPIIPDKEGLLTAEELFDPDNEIIFVQHTDEISTSDIEKGLQKFLEGKRSKTIKMCEIDGNPCYPVAFGNGELHVGRKFDKYLVAVPK